LPSRATFRLDPRHPPRPSHTSRGQLPSKPGPFQRFFVVIAADDFGRAKKGGLLRPAHKFDNWASSCRQIFRTIAFVLNFKVTGAQPEYSKNSPPETLGSLTVVHSG
jgi:hypothetical protein